MESFRAFGLTLTIAAAMVVVVQPRPGQQESIPSLDDVVSAMELAVDSIIVFRSDHPDVTGDDIVLLADADGDGRLSVAELIDHLQASGVDVSNFTGTNGILAKSDTFWDGGLTANEIDKWLWIDRRVTAR